MSSGAIEEAKCYETLLCLYGWDRDKAYSVYSELSRHADTSEPFACYAEKSKDIIGNVDQALSIWRSVRDAFDSQSIPFTVLTPESVYFPRMDGAFFPFIYASGNVSLLQRKTVTMIGMPRPSIQGRSDMLGAAGALMKEDGVVMAPLDAGLPSFALQVALRFRGNAIAVLSTPLSKCQSEQLIPLQRELMEKALVITVFAPSRSTERWFGKVRNSFIASISDTVFIAEEKDGGPSWSIADQAAEHGAKLMVPIFASSNPEYQWMKKHVEDGALVYSKEKDIRRLLPKKEKEILPDLFS